MKCDQCLFNMNSTPSGPQSQRIPTICPFYYGWFVVLLSFFANLTAAGIRSAPSVLIHPLEAEFGWSRTEIASAASLNLLLMGLFAPVGGWLIDRFGPRRVILGSLMRSEEHTSELQSQSNLVCRLL